MEASKYLCYVIMKRSNQVPNLEILLELLQTWNISEFNCCTSYSGNADVTVKTNPSVISIIT